MSLPDLFFFAAVDGRFRGSSHPGDAGNVLGSRPSLVFMCAAKHDRLNRQPAAQIEEARSFRSIKLVSGETGGVYQCHIDLYFAEGFDHDAVQKNTASAADLRNFPNRLNHSGLVVRS